MPCHYILHSMALLQLQLSVGALRISPNSSEVALEIVIVSPSFSLCFNEPANHCAVTMITVQLLPHDVASSKRRSLNCETTTRSRIERRNEKGHRASINGTLCRSP
eukprot:444515_1